MQDGNSNHESHQSFYRGPSDRLDNNANRDGRRDGDRSRFSNNRVSTDRDRDNGNWSRFSNNVRSDWSRRDRNDLPFVSGWWGNHGNRWGFSPFAYSRYRDRPYYWWGWTPAARLTDWFVFGWNRPRYWAYGPDANIYCQDDYVYYDGDRYLPVSDYYQQIYDLAHSVPKINDQEAQNMDWAPLGVFAVARDDQQSDESDRTIQLAVNKEGVLSGTFYDAKNGQAHPLTGMVDDHTQRAAWAFADDEQPKSVFETSIFNLTKPESTMMVHFGPRENDTEVWHLIRIERPEASQQANASGEDQQRQQDERNDLP